MISSVNRVSTKIAFRAWDWEAYQESRNTRYEVEKLNSKMDKFESKMDTIIELIKESQKVKMIGPGM